MVLEPSQQWIEATPSVVNVYTGDTSLATESGTCTIIFCD